MKPESHHSLLSLTVVSNWVLCSSSNYGGDTIVTFSYRVVVLKTLKAQRLKNIYQEIVENTIKISLNTTELHHLALIFRLNLRINEHVRKNGTLIFVHEVEGITVPDQNATVLFYVSLK